MARTIATLAVAATALLATATARAGNEESLFFGGEATMSAGATTALTNLPGAAWYNPAGLASMRRLRVTLTGTVFSFRYRAIDDGLTLRLPGGGEARGDIEDLSFRVIPAGVSLARSFGDRATVAFCLFVSERDSLYGRETVRGTAELEPGVATPFLGNVTLWRRDDTYNIGAAVGWELSPTLRLGVSAFVLIEHHRGRARMLTQSEGPDEDGAGSDAFLSDSEYDDVLVGGFAKFAIQWEPRPGWHLGVVLRTPTATLGQLIGGSTFDVEASMSPLFGEAVATRFSEEDSLAPRFALLVPFELRLALAYSSDRGWLGFESMIRPPQRDQTRGLDERLLWNARVGGIARVGRKLSLGGGLFTDNSVLASPQGLFNPAVDYYGATFGLRIRSDFRVRGNPRSDGLVFITTLAVRYALGVGQATTAIMNPSAADSGEVWAIEGEQDVLFHEFSFTLGSSVLF